MDTIHVMAKDPVIDQLISLSSTPEDRDAFDAWLEMHDAVSFLRGNAAHDEFVIYATSGVAFLHTVLVPSVNLKPIDEDDLLKWNFNAYSSWGISTMFGDEPKTYISNPLEDSGVKSFRGGEQLVFVRTFEGRNGGRPYHEVLQKFVHLSGLHFVPERQAYCRIDGRGDIEPVIRLVEITKKGEDRHSTIITCKRDVLDQYAAFSDLMLVRMFGFTKYRESGFVGWSNGHREKISDHDLIYRLHVEPGHASYLRGVQLVQARLSREEATRRFTEGEEKEKQYVSFIAQDWKNKRIVEISCDPSATADYFTDSDLPFEVSPAFFRPEVLIKYKSDSEKYTMQDRSISCRGTWHLESYDINEAGQVHAYIYDLRHLPYEEQLHWKAYNEPPKAPISKRAFTTDFEADWDIAYDPLPSVKAVLRDWRKEGVLWWELRDQTLMNRVNYPVTSSADEWANELLQLDQLVVEGFQEKWLRERAQELGRTPDEKFRSLKLLEEFLIGSGFEPDHAYKILTPLQQLHAFRSKLKGHASGSDAGEIKRQVIADHGSYRDHFRHLCAEVDESLRSIHRALNQSIKPA